MGYVWMKGTWKSVAGVEAQSKTFFPFSHISHMISTEGSNKNNYYFYRVLKNAEYET